MATMFHRCVLALILGSSLLPAAAEQRIASFATGSAAGVQVNPVTNRAYVATASGVAVIDGATLTQSLIGIAEQITALAVDPGANRIFAARSGAVTRIDVFDAISHDLLSSIPVPEAPHRIAVNPVTGDAYAVTSLQVMVIDGATLAIATVASGTYASALAVNAVTNKVYISADGIAPGIHVIDGVTRTSSLLTPGAFVSVVVNPVTNKVYARSAGNVTIVDGATAAAATIPVPGSCAIAVNPATNKIYVANAGPDAGTGGDVAVVDGATNAVTTVGAGVVRRPCALAVNAVTNTVYADSNTPGSTDVVAIDGATNAVRVFQVAAPTVSGLQAGMAVNPVTNTLYLTRNSGIVDVVDASTYTQSYILGTYGFDGVAAMSPTTGKLYIAQATAAQGTAMKVFDEATGALTNIPGGTSPTGIAVNHATNRIYVADYAGTVAVIDGASNAVTTIPAGPGPVAVAVNSVTNKVYVANAIGNNVTVIDGATLTAATIPAGSRPSHVVVNQATNRIYVLNRDSNDVTVIDGDSNTPSTISVAATPIGIALNAVTNKIYVANSGGNSVTILDGATLAATTVGVPSPRAIAVNPVNNRIYVTSFGASETSLVVIHGDTLATASLPIPYFSSGIAVDTVANKVYVGGPGSLTVIDARNHAVGSPVPVSTLPTAIEVSPITQRVYIVGQAHPVTVLRPFTQALGNHDTDVTMAGGHVSSVSSPLLSLSGCCPYVPRDPPVQAMFYRRGDARGVFSKATGPSPFGAQLSGLVPGLNLVTLFAIDALSGTSLQPGGSMTGAPRVFPIVYAPTSLVAVAPLSPVFVGGAVNQTIQASNGPGPFTFAITSGSLPAGVTLSLAGLLSGTPTESGFFIFRILVTDAALKTSTAVLALAVLAGDPPRLGNLSTRARAFGGNDVLIGGFVIGGAASKTIVVRARGPSLVSSGVTNALLNPAMRLVRSSDQTTVASNDDWGTAGNAAVISASGYAPASPLEAALLVNLEPGAYTAIVSGADGGTGVAIVEIFELDRLESPLANISTRGQVLTGNDVMIGGFVVQGTGPQTVVVRARGPSLAPFGIPNALGNPHLQLVRSSDQSTVASNDNWVDAANRLALESSGFAPANNLESAILITLDPGAYTAIVSGAGGTTGVGIVEVFTLP